MQGDEIRALRRLQREQEPSSHVFTSERGGPMTAKSFHTLIACVGAGRDAISNPPAHAASACGFALPNAGHDMAGLARPSQWLDQLLRPVLPDAPASYPQEDRCLCHSLGAPKVQTVAS
jgi:hypothetical protein